METMIPAKSALYVAFVSLTAVSFLPGPAAALPYFSAYEYHQSAVRCDSTQLYMIKQLPYVRDNSRVILEGNILSQVAPEHYLLGDYSGVVEVEISADTWGKAIITPDDTVRIEGAMAKDRHTILIMADNLSVVKDPA